MGTFLEKGRFGNSLYPILALYEIDGNTGTRPWKVNKSRNMRFWYLFTNMQFGEIGGESNARNYLQAWSVNKPNRWTHVQIGGFPQCWCEGSGVLSYYAEWTAGLLIPDVSKKQTPHPSLPSSSSVEEFFSVLIVSSPLPGRSGFRIPAGVFYNLWILLLCGS